MTFNFDSLKQITIKQYAGCSLGFLLLCYFLHTVLFPKVPYIADTRENLFTDPNNKSLLRDFMRNEWNYKRFYRFGVFGKKLASENTVPEDEIISNFGYKKEDVEETFENTSGFIIVLKAKTNH